MIRENSMSYEELLSFELVEDNTKLAITLKPAVLCKKPPDRPVNKDFLKTQISNAGYGRFYIFDDILEELSNDYLLKSEVVTKIAGEKRDAMVNVTVASDKMAAWLQVDPAYGGKELTRAMIADVLEQKGIVYGLKPEVIEDALAQSYLPNTVVAEGFTPVKGKDAYFESLIEFPDEKGRPKVREDGSVDYHDLGIVVTVEIGQHLMRKHPPTGGTTGMNVLGEELPSQVGKDKTFSEMKGSMISLEDSNLLIASTAGQPTLGPNYVKIDPVFRVGDVGYQTGDIKFSGTVIVNGGVSSGFTITAGGDVIVTGPVEASVIESWGNIDLKAGVIGQGKAKIKSKGNIHAKFIENAHIESEGSIFVSDMIMHSDVTASDRIEVGTGAGKGQIVGGTCRATVLVKSKIIGSTASTTTMIEVGVNPYLQKKLTTTKQDLDDSKKKLEETIKNIIHIRTHVKEGKEEIIKQLEEQRGNLLAKINELTETQNSLTEQLNMAVHAKAIATEHIYAGSKLRISEVLRIIDEDSLGCSFYLKGKEIVAGPI